MHFILLQDRHIRQGREDTWSDTQYTENFFKKVKWGYAESLLMEKNNEELLNDPITKSANK